MKAVPVKTNFAPPADSGLPAGALVIYENDGEPILACVTASKKGKYLTLNERGREAEFPAPRLYQLPGKMPGDIPSTQAKADWLSKMKTAAKGQAVTLNLGELWAVVSEEVREYSCKELCELLFSDNSLEHHLTLRLALIQEKVFFKRAKEGFEPRPAEIVEQLKKAEEARLLKEKAREVTLGAFKARLSDKSLPFPPECAYSIRLLEDTAAACEMDAQKQKEAKEALEMFSTRLGIELHGSREHQAFYILQRVGHFSDDTNLSLIRNRIIQHFDEAAGKEAETLQVPTTLMSFPEHDSRIRVDLTSVNTFTIDDESTSDMDDALSIETTPEGYRLGVYVSDVASVIQRGCVLDNTAFSRATSIYLPEKTIPMLPEVLSADKLSLVVGSPRPVMAAIFELGHDFEIISSRITPAIIRSSRKYSYTEVDRLLELEHSGDLGILYNIAVSNEQKRLEAGAQKIFKHDLNIILEEDGTVRLEEFDEHGPARGLVAEMMVMANAAMAEYALNNNIAVAYRAQEPPQETDFSEIPEGAAYDYAMRARLKKSSVSLEPLPHAGLGLKVYIQATSPIRRYVDLCNQRQILSHILSGQPMYSFEEFEKILKVTEEPLGDALATSRETRRYWLLRYLQQKKGRRLENGQPDDLIYGTVIRNDMKNPLVELDEVFFSALLRTEKRFNRGERLRLRLAAIDPRADYLKLEVA